MIVVYIERKITRNPIATAIAIMMLMNAPSPARSTSHQRNEILERTNFVARQQLLHFVRYGRRMVGAVALDKKDGCLIVRARHLLQRGHQHEQPRAFAVLDDSRHLKIVSRECAASAPL